MLLIAISATTYALAPWIARTMGGTVKSSGQGLMKAPTATQADFITWVLRAAALSPLLLGYMIAIFGRGP